MKKLLLSSALLLASQAANADGIYYCTKNGKKIMTDQPCQVFGANHSKYTPYDNLQPLSTMDPPNQSAVQRAKEFDREQTRRPTDQGNQAQHSNANTAGKNSLCLQLEQQKQNIVAQQRSPQSGNSHDWLRSRRQDVEGQIYSLGCETM